MIDTEEIFKLIRRKLKKNWQRHGKEKDHQTNNIVLSNTNPNKHWGWSQVLRKGK